VSAVVFDKWDWRSLRSGFSKNAKLRPTAPALVVGGKTISFEALESNARRWAHAIVDRLGRPARRVGVFAHKSETAYTGTMAALFSGATFVPLNRTFPAARTARMMEAADLDALIVDEKSLPQLEEALPPKRPQVILRPEGPAVMGGLGQAELSAFAPLATLPPVVQDDVAYLLFTSGSTGIPKGVPVNHKNVLHFIDVMVDRYRFTAEDRFTQTFDQTFDLSMFDLFCAWEVGACVYSMEGLDLLAPARFTQKNELTVWFSVPSIPALMRKKGTLKPNVMPSLKWSLFCGEPLPVAAAEEWLAAAPGSIVENLYGPTELTIACLLHRWDPKTSPALAVNEMVPIGRPYEGLGAIVIDDALKPVPDGAEGELAVCGPQTTPGYWRDPAKTADRFVTLEIPELEGLRFYRTGDRVRRLASGDYVCLGRMDHQIKVLGHRVELGEIESALRKQTGVIDAIAIGHPVVDGTANGIVAFVTGANLEGPTLIEKVRATLPDYMTPKIIHVIAEWPLNANGKIDRNALKARLESGTAGA
jgi:amino acid adenylation domain-containing protein